MQLQNGFWNLLFELTSLLSSAFFKCLACLELFGVWFAQTYKSQGYVIASPELWMLTYIIILQVAYCIKIYIV